jgi:hypothetical protein
MKCINIFYILYIRRDETMLKKLIVISTMVVVSFSATSCSLVSKRSSDKNVPGTQTQQQAEENKNTDQAQDKTSEQVEDKDLAEKLKGEKIVKNGMVYTQNNTAVAVIIAKEEAKKEEVNKLAESYSKELKAKYKDMKVVVQALVNNKDWINIEL